MTDGLIHEIHCLREANEALKATVARLEEEKAALETAHETLRGEWRKNLEKLGTELQKFETLLKERLGNE